MWNELGISGGTAIVILIALYFVIKWAVKNGMKEAYSAITGKKTDEDIKNEKELKELGLDSENQKLPVYRALPPQGLGHRTPQQEAVPKGQEFSRIENLWPRDDSCSHTFTLFAIFFLESLSFFRYNKTERRRAL